MGTHQQQAFFFDVAPPAVVEKKRERKQRPRWDALSDDDPEWDDVWNPHGRAPRPDDAEGLSEPERVVAAWRSGISWDGIRLKYGIVEWQAQDWVNAATNGRPFRVDRVGRECRLTSDIEPRPNGKWRAWLRAASEKILLGHFDTEQLAIDAWLIAKNERARTRQYEDCTDEDG